MDQIIKIFRHPMFWNVIMPLVFVVALVTLMLIEARLPHHKKMLPKLKNRLGSNKAL